MTPGEATAWLQATERSRFAWQLDEIHATVDDALIYRGGKAGYFIQVRRLYTESRPRQPLNRWGVEVGTYEGAIPHIGEATFTTMGRKAFPTAEQAYFFIGDKVPGTALLCESVCPEAAPHQDEPPEDDPDRVEAYNNDPERRALSNIPPYDGKPNMPRGWFEREWPRG